MNFQKFQNTPIFKELPKSVKILKKFRNCQNWNCTDFQKLAKFSKIAEIAKSFRKILKFADIQEIAYISKFAQI